MADTIETKSGPRRLWKIVLVCSLALNLAVVGLVVGTVASGRVGDGPPRSFDLGVGPLAQALNQQERREVGRELRQARVLRDINPRARANEMSAIIAADPFDPDALRAIFATQRNEVSRVQERAQEVLFNLISDMTPERRAEFATQIEEALKSDRGPRGPRPSGG